MHSQDMRWPMQVATAWSCFQDGLAYGDGKPIPTWRKGQGQEPPVANRLPRPVVGRGVPSPEARRVAAPLCGYGWGRAGVLPAPSPAPASLLSAPLHPMERGRAEPRASPQLGTGHSSCPVPWDVQPAGTGHRSLPRGKNPNKTARRDRLLPSPFPIQN